MANNPYVNKVTLANGTTLLDLSSDTLTAANQLLSGITAHARDGSSVTGNVVIQHYYTGSSAPSSSLGVNGDIYLKT